MKRPTVPFTCIPVLALGLLLGLSTPTEAATIPDAAPEAAVLALAKTLECQSLAYLTGTAMATSRTANDCGYAIGVAIGTGGLCVIAILAAKGIITTTGGVGIPLAKWIAYAMCGGAMAAIMDAIDKCSGQEEEQQADSGMILRPTEEFEPAIASLGALNATT